MTKNVQAASKQYYAQGGGVWGTAIIGTLAARSTAVAGSAIQMDAGETDVDLFRNRLYVWDFGDAGSGSWQDGKPKNSDVGPIAGHVYETPGTYVISCKVYDATGLISTLTDSVTITDPDVVYAGALTTCISTGADFTGAPAGSTNVTVTDLSTISTYLGTGKRLLFKRGDSWTGDAGVIGHNYADIDDVYVGAFGAGATPDTLGHFANDPTIAITGVTGTYPLFNFLRCSRWVISHLALSGPAAVRGWTYGSTDLVDITYFRIKSDGFDVPVGATFSSSQGHIGISYVETRVADGETNNMYVGSEKLLILGCVYEDVHTSHNIRVWHGHRWAARHNHISGSSINNTSGRQLLKYHGQVEADIKPVGPWAGSQIRTRSEYAVISDNVFGAGGPWPVSIAPSSPTYDERIKAVILENNKHIGDFGTNSPVVVAVAIRIVADSSVIRNEIIDATGMNTKNMNSVSVLTEIGVPARTDTHVYNCTTYLKEGNNYSNGVVGNIIVEAGVLNTIIKNNLCNSPASATAPIVMVLDDGTSTVQSSNLLTADPKYTDPTNATPLLRDFSLLAGSLGLGAGEDVPVFQDIDGNPRVSGAYDLGAYQE